MSEARTDASCERGSCSRRRFLRTCACAGATLAAPRVVFARSREASRPNFLWIDVEDISPHLGCYGCDYMNTPRIDELASQGVRYTNFGGPAAICAPNRSAFITGMYPTTVGAHQMRCDAVEDPTIKLLVDYLRQAGYFCANREKTDYQGLAGAGMGGQDRWSQFGTNAHYKNRPAGSDFWFERNWGGTHEGQVWEPRDNPRPDMVLPPYYPETDLARRQWEAYLWPIEWLDYDGAGPLLDELENQGLVDDTIVFFFGDHGAGMPRAKSWLYDSGLIAPLIIRIPERFRVDGQGEPGTVDDELVSFMDLAPTMLNLAGLPIPSYMQGRAFLGSDLTPPREYLFAARDRIGERYDLIRMVRDKRYKYLRNYEPWEEYTQWIWYREQHGMMKQMRRAHEKGELNAEQELFFADHKPWEELYDLKDDPYELRNLAGSAAHMDILDRMRKAHENWVLETHDLGFIPEGILDERAKAAASHYKVAMRDNGAESKAAWEAACLLKKGELGLTDLVAAMDSTDDAVRYWAAIGLGNLLDMAVSAKPKLRAALNDQSAAVRVAAARSLAFMGEAATAVPKLVAEAKNMGNNPHVRLLALDCIDRLGNLAKGMASAITADPDSDCAYVVPRIAATIDDEPRYPAVADLPLAAARVSPARPAASTPVRCTVRGRRLVVSAKGEQAVRAALYNANGGRVCEVALAPGQTQVIPRGRALPAGTYVLQMRGITTYPAVKIRVP